MSVEYEHHCPGWNYVVRLYRAQKPRSSTSHCPLLASELVGRKFFITHTSSVLAPTV